MKKFEEKLEQLKNNSHTNFYGYMGIRLLTEPEIIEIFKDWVSPEDHQKVVEDLTNARSSITNLMAQLDYYKKDKRFEVMAEEILSLKSQLEKQQPEIPEFVAEFIKKYKGNWSLFGAFRNISGNKVNNEILYSWVFAHAGRQELFAQAWVYGYTVAKEKRFYLKNKLTGGYIEQDCWNGTRETYNRHDITEFTQQEIDSMETGSYEQIEVEE